MTQMKYWPIRFAAREMLWKPRLLTTLAVKCVQPMATAPAKLRPNEDFWVKNKRLQRPLSPHLTIYKPQLTAMLSITHRGSGAAMASVLWGFSLGMLVLPGSFPHYLTMVQSLHLWPSFIFTVKYGLAWILIFHMCNGIRHLAWDLGYGFEIKTLYKTGWLVFGSTFILAGIAASM
ncbi:succinate dehydrogenase cytochrome b560 subunit, mitochondrial-like isoform X2 [Tachypleus tridentatus]|uniref:succinate dehydrogenase cytochrome b560 subunit, mitochondrial-like isoform X2 n=1 Tax=Tachypleus tridentatus TaxID=6853 RepID=UPI003FD6B2A7